MAVTRRVVLQALAATGIGAITGTGAYGFLYGRHELELTSVTLPVAGLPPALNGLRIILIDFVPKMADYHKQLFQIVVGLYIVLIVPAIFFMGRGFIRSL